MRKIPTLFARDETRRGHPVVDTVTLGCEWVLAYEGIATRKLDGQNVRVTRFEDGRPLLDKRQKPKERDYDDAAYVACDRSDPADRWLWHALEHTPGSLTPGIYEAVGPQFQGDPHGYGMNQLVRVLPLNDDLVLRVDPTRTFEGLRFYLDTMCGAGFPTEGIVFHHPDGRMAKIKRRDFGLSWPVKVAKEG